MTPQQLKQSLPGYTKVLFEQIEWDYSQNMQPIQVKVFKSGTIAEINEDVIIVIDDNGVFYFKEADDLTLVPMTAEY
jgi:hypothetical protein